MMSNVLVLLLVFLSTLFVLFFIHRERETFAKRAARHVNARQAVHTVPTPRVGGVAIAVGILSGALLSGNDLFGTLLWTTLPIFVIGLLEDLGPNTPPSLRLGVAALSAILAITTTSTVEVTELTGNEIEVVENFDEALAIVDWTEYL